jgi:hypothetical protein
MLVWGTVFAFLLSLLAVGPLRGFSPQWIQTGAEFLAAITLIARIRYPDRSGIRQTFLKEFSPLCDGHAFL